MTSRIFQGFKRRRRTAWIVGVRFCAAVFIGAVICGCRPEKDQRNAAAATPPGIDRGVMNAGALRIVVPSSFVGPLVVVVADSGAEEHESSSSRVVATPGKAIMRVPAATASGAPFSGIVLVSDRTGRPLPVVSDCQALFDTTSVSERIACALPSVVVYRTGTHTPDYVAFVLATRDSLPQTYERAGRLLRDSVVHDAYAALPWKAPQRP